MPTRALHVFARPSGLECRPACRYCFYTKKEAVYPAAGHGMPDAVPESFTRQYIWPARVCEFLKGNGVKFMQFIPLVKRVRPDGTPVNPAGHSMPVTA